MADPIKRPNYFDHQFLKAADFTAEQDYHRGMRHLHDRLFHQPGVVRGLAVTLNAGAAVIGAGVALDSSGNEIVLAADTPCPDPSSFQGKTAFLAIAYRETSDGKAHTVEAPLLSLSATAPADPGALVLAKLTVDAGGRITASDTSMVQSAAASPDLVAHSITWYDPGNSQDTWPRMAAGTALSTVQITGSLSLTGDLSLAGDLTSGPGATFRGPVTSGSSSPGVSVGPLFLSGGTTNGNSLTLNARRNANSTNWIFSDPTSCSITVEMDDALGFPRFEIYATRASDRTKWNLVFGINCTTGLVTIPGSLSAGDILLLQSNTKIVVPSDGRLKTNIQGIDRAAEKLTAIRGVSFEFRGLGRTRGHREIGVIAQEVEQVLPELVGASPKTGLKGVDYGKLNAVVVEAVKQLQQRIRALESEIASLEQPGPAAVKEPA